MHKEKKTGDSFLGQQHQKMLFVSHILRVFLYTSKEGQHKNCNKNKIIKKSLILFVLVSFSCVILFYMLSVCLHTCTQTVVYEFV